MVSSTSRILSAIYLIIISVVLLAEVTLFYVIGILPIDLPQIIIFALVQTITPTIIFLYVAFDFFYMGLILLYMALNPLVTPAYLSFFLFIAGYMVSLALFPEAHVKDRLWLSLGLSTSLLVIIPLFTRIFESIFPSFTLFNTYWTILIIAICCDLVYIKRRTVKAVRKEVLGWVFALLHRLNLLNSTS